MSSNLYRKCSKCGITPHQANLLPFHRFPKPGTNILRIKKYSMLETMKELYRKCIMCGKSPALDSSITVYRFPRPGKTNFLRCESWAKICFPQSAWSSVEFQEKLHAKHKMLCHEHFEETSFIDFNAKRLHRFACPAIRRTLTGAGNSNVSGDQSENQTAVSDHSKNETSENDHSKNQTAVSDYIKYQTTVSDHSKNQTAVSDHSKNQTAVSDHRESQPAVNINIEDAVDGCQYLAGVDTLTGAHDDCYNISDDDCQAVDDDSSFYHNVSKLSDDKDDVEGEPQNLDENEDLHDGFKCNFCSGEIKGYRYTCVQCPDYDLCGSCEARGLHCLHYVLRIPRPKPYTEIQPLLSEIRRLLSGAHTDVLWTQADEIKEESNDEVMMNVDDPLDIDSVTTALSETEDNVPEITTLTSVTKSHENRQDNNDNVQQMTMQMPYIRHKKTVAVDKRSASTSSPYPASTRLIASNRNTLQTRTPASESSQCTASTSVSSDGNTVLTIATNVGDTDSASRPVPATPALHAPASITPGDTETVYNKTNITGDSRLQVPMATKRKCSDNIEASKPSPVVLLKGSKKFIVVPSISKGIGPGTRFKIIKKPSATGQPQAPGAVSAARHRNQSTQRDQHAAT